MTKPRDLPWLPLYTRDLRAATEHWTDEEFGAYMRLLIHQWDHGAIPTEPKRIAMIAPTARKHWTLIGPKFPGGVNPRMAKERADRSDLAAERSEIGRAGAAARWHGKGIASSNGNGIAGGIGKGTGKAMACQSQSQSQNRRESKGLDSLDSSTKTTVSNSTPPNLAERGPEVRGIESRVESGRVPQGDEFASLRESLTAAVAELVEQPRARLGCLAAIERMNLAALRKASRDVAQARREPSPGGVLVHRWTRNTKAQTRGGNP